MKPLKIEADEQSKWPAYLALAERGLLAQRAQEARLRLLSCDLCSRRCRVNRLEGELGACRVGGKAIVASYGPHYGEESPLVGYGGSGTIFFSGCNLKCIYCQNYDISALRHGSEATDQMLASIMLQLQQAGCHNINLVSPTHVVPQIVAAVEIAAQNGLHLPLVYNSGGYDSPVAMKLLDSLIDIYMPDAKYSDSSIGLSLSGVRNYPAVNRAMIRASYRQVGNLAFDKRGVATRGLLVRHLILPENLAGSEKVLGFLANEVSRSTYVNIMDQYHPCFQFARDPRLGRRIKTTEYESALNLAEKYGLYRIDGFWEPTEEWMA